MQLVSERLMRKMHARAVEQQRSGWTRIDWQLLQPEELPKNVKLVQARCVCVCARTEGRAEGASPGVI